MNLDQAWKQRNRAVGNSAALPGMTSAEERWLLRETARCEISGRGEVVDLGCWLGSLTASLADGMAENPRLRGAGRKVQAFDRFVWEKSYMERYWKKELRQDPPDDGGNFRDVFESVVEPWQGLIEVHAVELESFTWSGAAVEFLSVDAMKSLDLASNIIKKFFPCLISSDGFIFQQDFCHYYTWWIHLYHYLLNGHFVAVKSIEGSGGVLFKVVSPVTSGEVAAALATDLADPLLADRAFAQSMEIVCEANRKAVAAAHERCELHFGRYDRARLIRERHGLA